MDKVRIIDTTLRDGSHAIHHRYTLDQVHKISAALEKAGVYAAEVGHGAGLGGSVIQYGLGKHTDRELISAARSELKNTKLAALLIPGLSTMDDLREAVDCGLDVVRIASHCTEMDVCEQHIRLAKKMGLETIGFFMMSHMISVDELAEQAKMVEEFGADTIYFADSSGHMTPQDVRDRVAALCQAVKVPIGIHTHNNLGLGIGNAIAAIEAGAAYADSTIDGLGAGCGNANTQALAAVLSRMGIDCNVDFYKLVDVSENVVRPMMQHTLEITNEAVMLGYAGIYSSFYLHVMNAAQKFELNPKDIFDELSRRKVVGGQEDQIIDICYNILGVK